MAEYQRVVFKLIQMPCCGHMLCWVNPRFPTYCPECGTHIFRTVKQGVMFSDDEAVLETHGN
jgi:hypothetical protein